LFLLFEVEKRSAPGGTIKTITKERLNSFELPLPRIEEQQKIADFLTSVDTRIQQLKQKQSLLQQYKKGLMQKLFSQVLLFKDDNGNSFPDWVSHTLGDIGDTYSGLSGKSGEDFGQGQDFITYKQIFDRSEIDVSKCGKVHVEPGERQNLVQTGDVLFTTSSETRAEVGFASVLLEEGFTCFLNSFCFGYRADSQVLSPIFSRYLFHSQDARKRISILGQGSTRFNMSKTAFMKTKFYLPCLAEQEKIANALAAMDQKIDLVAKQIEHTQTFKKGLLQQMFV
jgi:type I restriction enzyme S subunit